MRDVTGVEIEQYILHLTDPRRAQGLVLSQRAQRPQDNPLVATYFTEHIERALGDQQVRAARFSDLAAGQAAQVCQALLDGRLDLLSASQRLATALHALMARDKRISGGDLAICTYRAASTPDVSRYLALLKIDAVQVLHPRTNSLPDGSLIVDFDLINDVLPTTRERLQKCAFVQPLNPRPAYDMLLLDRQSTAPTPDAVARFFIDDFLGAAYAFDERTRTDTLYRCLVSAQSTLRANQRLTSEQDETLRVAIEQVVRAPEVNIDALLESLPLPEAEKQFIDQQISAELPDRVFEIDPDYGQKLVKRRLFRGDHGLRVSLKAEKYDQVVRSVRQISQAGEPPLYEIVLHSGSWEEIVP